MKKELSERLSCVYDLVTVGGVVADVGCDHAFLSIALVADGRAIRAIAIDVNRGPLERARQHIAENGLSDRIDILQSDGLTELDTVPDSIVICGMGGSLIVSILEKGLEIAGKTGELILSPQSDAAMVRYWFYDHGFSLSEERALVDSGKYYQIIKTIPDGRAAGWGDISPFSMKYGPYLLAHRDKALKGQLENRIDVIESITGNLDSNEPRYKELKGEESLCRIFVR